MIAASFPVTIRVPRSIVIFVISNLQAIKKAPQAPWFFSLSRQNKWFEF